MAGIPWSRACGWTTLSATLLPNAPSAGTALNTRLRGWQRGGNEYPTKYRTGRRRKGGGRKRGGEKEMGHNTRKFRFRCSPWRSTLASASLASGSTATWGGKGTSGQQVERKHPSRTLLPPPSQETTGLPRKRESDGESERPGPCLRSPLKNSSGQP